MSSTTWTCIHRDCNDVAYEWTDWTAATAAMRSHAVTVPHPRQWPVTFRIDYGSGATGVHYEQPTPAASAPEPYPATALQDCEVCGGMGAMTARAADAPDALPAVIPCPACGGRGATLRPFPPKLAAVRDA